MASEEEQRAQKEDAMPDLGLPSKREKMQPVCRIPDIHVHCIVQCASYMVSTYMGLHHLQIRKGLSFMHATRQPPIQILSRIYIPSGDCSGGGGKVGDQGKDFAGGTTRRRKVRFASGL